MQILLNGKPEQAPQGETVAALLERLALTGKRVAVEIDGHIVPRSEHATTQLTDGCKIEVVHAIGGG